MFLVQFQNSEVLKEDTVFLLICNMFTYYVKKIKSLLVSIKNIFKDRDDLKKKDDQKIDAFT